MKEATKKWVLYRDNSGNPNFLHDVVRCSQRVWNQDRESLEHKYPGRFEMLAEDDNYEVIEQMQKLTKED